MNSCFIILAGGESKRFNSKTPKSYHFYKGKPLLLHSIDKAKSYKKFKKIVLVINKKHKKLIKDLKIKDIKIIVGGNTRAESSYKALRSIKNYNIKNIMIHDAARPNFSLKLLDKLHKELQSCNCVIPAIQTSDSVKQKNSNTIKNLIRDNIYLVQTPQAFNYKALYNLQSDKSINVTDDASLFVNANNSIFSEMSQGQRGGGEGPSPPTTHHPPLVRNQSTYSDNSNIYPILLFEGNNARLFSL